MSRLETMEKLEILQDEIARSSGIIKEITYQAITMFEDYKSEPIQAPQETITTYLNVIADYADRAETSSKELQEIILSLNNDL